MRRLSRSMRYTLGLTMILLVTDRVAAVPFDIADFFRISGAEFLNPRFDIAGGQTTVNSYSGFVEVLVTGAGRYMTGR